MIKYIFWGLVLFTPISSNASCLVMLTGKNSVDIIDSEQIRRAELKTLLGVARIEFHFKDYNNQYAVSYNSTSDAILDLNRLASCNKDRK